MCVVSMVGDHFSGKWIHRFPEITGPFQDKTVLENPISRREFDELKKEVLEMKELLKRAVDYDRATGQPDCHMDEKIILLRKIAELVGVDIEEVFKS